MFARENMGFDFNLGVVCAAAWIMSNVYGRCLC
jgi:hypothetical protein